MVAKLTCTEPVSKGFAVAQSSAFAEALTWLHLLPKQT